MELWDIKYDNILNPEEAFKEFKNSLIHLYTDDYGDRYFSVIRDRIDNTYYLFDSTPIDAYNFYKNNKNRVNFGFKNIFRIESEYSNYIMVEKKIDRILSNKYKNELSKFYNISVDNIDDQFLEIDYEAYSFENMRKLHDPSISDDNRNSILKRQRDYVNFCKLYGVIPITDISVIDKIVKIKKDLERVKFKTLLDETTWGKRIVKDIYKKTGEVVDTDYISSAMFDKACCASVFHLGSPSGKMLRICYYPVMRNFNMGCMDKIFYHENRHVVESGNGISGFNVNEKYRYINEIRTQENAIRDAYEFRRVPLFCNCLDSSTGYVIYEKLFDYCGPFVKKYLGFLNDIGITNDVGRLEYFFGDKNLSELEDFLTEADKSLLRGFTDKLDMGRQMILNYNLDSHFASRQR